MAYVHGYRERAWVTDAERWTRTHLAAPGERETLCGRRIPVLRVVYDGGLAGPCLTCRKRAKANPRERGEDR